MTENTKIITHFELHPPILLGDILQQVEDCSSIHRLAATPEAWNFHVVFHSFDTARALFTRFSDQDLDVDVHWMWKGQPLTTGLTRTV